MLGAIIGDIVGSRFEFNNIKTKDFELFTNDCSFTDDTVMTIAIGLAIIESGYDICKLSILAKNYMQVFGRLYPDVSYGTGFRRWLYDKDAAPYYSFGNGAAMRVSACGFMARNIEEAFTLARIVTQITHNHPEGIKGVEATSTAIFWARHGKTKEEIKKYVIENFYNINFTLDEIRPTYKFDESCQGTVPQALECFFESSSFEDAIRNAISIGGDSDTIGAITGAVAEAYYGIPKNIKETAYEFLEKNMVRMIEECQKKFSK